MPGNLEFLKYKQNINSNAAEAYRAFTTSTALSEWLCDQAFVQSEPGGSLYLWWQNKYCAFGQFTELEPKKKIGFTWQGKDDPSSSRVQVAIKQKEEGIQVNLIHSELGTGKNWKKTRNQIDNGWQTSLENLKSMLEEGQDARLARRPMMGITGIEPVSDEIAQKHNLPKAKGLLLFGVIDGMGAQNAGLHAGDILLKFDGKKLSRDQDLYQIIEKHKAGDTVKVSFYRDGQKHNTELTFSERLHYDIPQNPTDLAAQVEAMYKSLLSEYELLLKGVSEEKACAFPAEGEWNIKQVLAHLIIAEKDTHYWISALMEDQDSYFEFHANKTERLNAVVSVCPTVNALIKDLKRNTTETVALINHLPENFITHKRSYNRLGEFLLSSTFHYQDHIAQIKNITENNLP